MLWSKTRSGRGGTRLSGMCRPKIRPTIDRYIDRHIDRHYYSKQDPTLLGESQKAGNPPPGGGETPHMKGVGMLVGNFALNP